MDYEKIATTLEIWRAIMAQHKDDLSVFSSYSAPEGDFYGNPSQAVMMTEYGFKNADCPLIGARTTWSVHPSRNLDMEDEATEYWFCLPINEAD